MNLTAQDHRFLKGLKIATEEEYITTKDDLVLCIDSLEKDRATDAERLSVAIREGMTWRGAFWFVAFLLGCSLVAVGILFVEWWRK